MIAGSVYDAASGGLTVSGSEALVVVSGSPAPWTVTFRGVSQPVITVSQAGPNVLLTTSSGGTDTILLSYAGGPYVKGAASDLLLEAVVEFPVTVV